MRARQRQAGSLLHPGLMDGRLSTWLSKALPLALERRPDLSITMASMWGWHCLSNTIFKNYLGHFCMHLIWEVLWGI